MINLALILILSYLVGAIPTAIIASRILIHDDIRKYGSHNAGATNVFRVLGWKPALVVLLIDMGKGALATLVIARMHIEPIPINPQLISLLAGFFAIIGHVWTVFAGFKGGKGVGTAFGVCLGILPLPTLFAFGTWLLCMLLTRIVSLSSIISALAFPVLVWIQKSVLHRDTPDFLFWMSVGLGVFIVFTHRSNLKRLFRGEEKPLKFRKGAEK